MFRKFLERIGKFRVEKSGNAPERHGAKSLWRIGASGRSSRRLTLLPLIPLFLLGLGWPAQAGAETFAYVANYGSSNVSVIRTLDNTVVATPETGTGPIGVGISADGAFVCVANQGGSRVSIIRTADNAALALVPVVSDPYDCAFTPDGAFVYAPNATAGRVSVIRTADYTVVATVAGLGSYPMGWRLPPMGPSPT